MDWFAQISNDHPETVSSNLNNSPPLAHFHWNAYNHVGLSLIGLCQYAANLFQLISRPNVELIILSWLTMFPHAPSSPLMVYDVPSTYVVGEFSGIVVPLNSPLVITSPTIITHMGLMDILV